MESKTQGSRPMTQKNFEAEAKDRLSLGQIQGHMYKCSPEKKGLQKFFSGDRQKKTFSKNFFGAPQNFNNSKIPAVLEPRTGQFSRT